MSNRDLTPTTVAKVQSYGFAVYMRKPGDTYLFFTDGQNIGYLQSGDYGGFSLSTVHVPSSQSGTGYQIARNVDSFDKAALEQCFIRRPDWARGDAMPVKWKSIDAMFASKGIFGRSFALVPDVVERDSND